MLYVIQVCWQLVSRIRTSWSCSQAVSKPVWHIPLLCVQWAALDDGQRNWPKHVEFYSKNKIGKLVHLVGFIIRIYHDALSPERHKRQNLNYLYAFLMKVSHSVQTAQCNNHQQHFNTTWYPLLSFAASSFLQINKPLMQFWAFWEFS